MAINRQEFDKKVEDIRHQIRNLKEEVDLCEDSDLYENSVGICSQLEKADDHLFEASLKANR